MRLFINLTTSLILIVSMSSLSLAQSASPEHLKSASQLVSLEKSSDSYKTVLGAVIRDTMRLFMQTNPDLQKDIEAVGSDVEKQLEGEAETLKQEIIRLYTQNFTKEEIESIITFYETPIGEKLLEKRGSIEQSILTKTISWGESMSEKAVSAMREGLQAKGHSF